MNRHWRQLVILPMLIFLLVLPIQALAAKSLYQWAKQLNSTSIVPCICRTRCTVSFQSVDERRRCY